MSKLNTMPIFRAINCLITLKTVDAMPFRIEEVPQVSGFRLFYPIYRKSNEVVSNLAMFLKVVTNSRDV